MEKGINRKNIALTARVFKDNSRNEEGGTGNFRFCAISNCPPHIPYFPSSYHKGDICFSIGMENSSLLHKAFKNGMGLDDTRASLKPVLEEETSRIEGIATEIAASMGIGFSGIDASITPSLSREESIAFAFERLGLGKFGKSGTLSIAGMVTSVLKGLSIKTCGYTGLMLPLCEDYGLAKRADEGCFGINDLLLFSSVCGCGLDTIPIAGDVENDRIEALLLDVASLSLKLNKPLSARLLPIPNKGVGEYTCFNSPYMVDCRVMDI